MPPTIPIQTPDPETERPRAWTVAAVALAALVVGILLVRSTLEPAAEVQAPRGEDEASVAPPQSPDPAPAEAAPTDAAHVDAEDDAPAAPEREDVQEPEPAVQPTGAPATDRRVRFGRIAYLRCDGAETDQGPYPCPRDRDLERAALAAIETLPACPNAPPGTGEADVRIHYVPGSPNEILLRGGSGEGRLDGPRVLACLREPLSRLTTTIEADQLVVSFRFELVPAD